jgi:hypothetical protein
MKNIVKIVAAAVLAVGVVGCSSAPGVGAVSQGNGACTSIVISNTGANSYNSGVCTVVTNVVATCTNNLYVLDSNTQSAVTGQASQLGNTSGSPAISGSATNQNGTSVQLGASCTPPQSTTTSTTASTTPTIPAAAPAAPQKAKTLPFTASNSLLEVTVISIIVVATILASIRLAITAYQRIATK